MSETHGSPGGKEQALPASSHSNERRPALSTKISPIQAAILVGLTLAVFCVMGALVVALRANSQLLSELAVPDPTTAVATPTPVPSAGLVPTTAPSSTVTSAPRLPTPTATLVVPPDFINRDKLNQIRAIVVNVRGLQPLREVPSQFLTRAQLRQHLETEYAAASVSSALERRREILVALDLLDPSADFRKIALDSAAQNIGGFYSPEEQVLYLVAESVNMFASEEVVYAHEYTHALQDQHFGLTRFLGEGMNADEAIAARALVEGDATLVMEAYQFSEITPDQLEYLAYRASLAEPEVIERVSPSLGVLTLFPYLQGSAFAYALWADAGLGWDKIDAAYQDPPVSSEQIMHPEKYLAHDAPRVVSLPDLSPALGKGWREVERDVLGEVGLLAWLLDHLDWNAASEGAAGWDGDMVTLWSDGQGSTVLVARSIWDAPGEAAEFFETFTDYLTRRALGVPQLTLNEAGRRVWEYEGRATFLARAGDQVLIILAPDRAVLDGVRSLFPEF